MPETQHGMSGGLKVGIVAAVAGLSTFIGWLVLREPKTPPKQPATESSKKEDITQQEWDNLHPTPEKIEPTAIENQQKGLPDDFKYGPDMNPFYAGSSGSGIVRPDYTELVQYIVDKMGQEIFQPANYILVKKILVDRVYDTDKQSVSHADWLLITNTVNNLKNNAPLNLPVENP